MNIESLIVESIEGLFETYKVFKKVADEEYLREYNVTPGTEIFSVEGVVGGNKYCAMVQFPPTVPNGFVHNEIAQMVSQLKNHIDAN